MALIDDVLRLCKRLVAAEPGWQELLRIHGLDIGKSSRAALEAELARDISATIDRTFPGFEDFSTAGKRGIEPGSPARSLLLHALASPNVVSRKNGTRLTAYPTLAEIETVENYVFGVRPLSLQELTERVGGKPLAVVVFAYEYRPASQTCHGRHADMAYARTGIARTPAVEFGVNAPDDPVGPGIASLTRKTLHRVMNELIAAWETVAEVRHTYILTAHAADAHQEALSTIRATGVVSLVDIFSVDLRPQLERPDGPIHGGEIDTSILLHLAPELVAQGRMPPGLAATDLKGARFFNAILEAVVRHVGAR